VISKYIKLFRHYSTMPSCSIS